MANDDKEQLLTEATALLTAIALKGGEVDSDTLSQVNEYLARAVKCGSRDVKLAA